MKLDLKLKPKIIIHCQYVYGIGHLVRTVELARGLSINFQVFIFNGGEKVPNFYLPKDINLIQLPAIYKKENNKTLLPVDSSTNIEECFQKRKIIIEKKIEEIKPDIIITEHFPFGLLFENEVTNLISKTKILNPFTKIISSVRDIIENNSGSINDEYISELINKWYDLVLIHGDVNYVHLNHSFTQIRKILVPIHHTGYIVRDIPRKIKTDTKHHIILASVAAGRLGAELLEAIIASHLLIKQKIKHKLILFSGAFQSDFKELQKTILDLKSEDIELNSFDSMLYLDYLSQANLVISLGGYNSIIESISAQKKLLVYQRVFSEGNEEQDLRIKLFEDLGYLQVIKRNDLKIKELAEVVVNTIKKEKSSKLNLDLNGVQNSVKLILELINPQM